MNILHVIGNLEIRRGGSARACAELAESTGQLGCRVVIWFVGGGDEPTFVPHGVTLSIHPSRRGSAFSLEAIRSLWCQVGLADIVHIHEAWRFATLAAAVMALIQRKPYIVQPHGALHPWKLAYKRLRKRLYFELFERHVLARAAALLAESNEDAEDLRRLVPFARILTVPCGAYPERFCGTTHRPTLTDLWPQMIRRVCILFLSRIDVNKGLDLLLVAFRQLVDERSEDLGLLIVGPNHNGTWETIQRRGLLVGIEDRIHYTGMVSEAEKVAALRGCDIYVLPSLSENFGISVLEALMSAAPVVTTTATPWREIEECGAGVIVEPSARGIARGIRRLLNVAAQERADMGKRGQEYAIARYHWHLVADQMMKHYRSLVSRKDFPRATASCSHQGTDEAGL